jgi:hypothetical protein
VPTLSDSAAFLVQELLGGTRDAEALTSALCGEFDVTPEQTRRDVEAFVEGLAAKRS